MNTIEKTNVWAKTNVWIDSHPFLMAIIQTISAILLLVLMNYLCGN
jgi:hypothetical protein